MILTKYWELYRVNLSLHLLAGSQTTGVFKMKKLCLFWSLLSLSLLSLQAQAAANPPKEGGATDEKSNQELAAIAIDPLAFASKFILQNISVPIKDGDVANELQMSGMVPVPLGLHVNMLNRLLLPMDTRPTPDGGSNTGLGNLQYQVYFSNSQGWGNDRMGRFTLGLGPSVTFDTTTFDTGHNWAVGASLLATYKYKGFLTLVAYNPAWGVGAEKKNTQSILAMISYVFKTGTSILTFPYMVRNEDTGKWLIPLGGGVGQFVKIGKLKMNLTLSAYYILNAPSILGDNKLEIQASVGMLLPNPFVRAKT